MLQEEYTSKIDQKPVRKSNMYMLTEEERKEMLSTLGDSAVILYEFYLRKAGYSDYSFKDEDAARKLAWDISKVQRTRLKLVKAGWFYQSTGKLTNHKKITVTYLGKKCVNEAKILENIKVINSDPIVQQIKALTSV